MQLKKNIDFSLLVIQCSFINMKENRNYYREFLKDYNKIRSETPKDELPKLLLHICCGACSCFPLVFLTDLFDITVYYTNSNIYPESEFEKRFEALKKYVEFVEKACKTQIKIIKDTYNHDEFICDLLPFKDEEEGGHRCKICIEKRFKRTFDFASSHGFKYVTTVMSISRNKDVDYLNMLGEELAKKYNNLTYVHADFKKNNGQDIGVDLSKKIGIYRQCFCGCEFSK